MSENEPGSVDASADEIVVRYRWTADELIKAQRWHAQTIARRWAYLLLMVAVFCLGIILLFKRIYITAASMFLSFAILVMRRVLAGWFVHRQFAKRPDRDVELEWSLSAAGLRMRSALGVSGSAWIGITRVVQSPDGYLFYPNHQIFHWLPRGAFASDADFERVAKLAREKVADYRVVT